MKKLITEILPIPEFTDLDIAFGASEKAYCSKDEGCKLEKEFRKEADAASKLFFNGGTLEQHGLTFKDEVDRTKAMRALKALMCSFEPSHEAKIGTIARYLNSWCRPCKPAAAKAAKDR